MRSCLPREWSSAIDRRRAAAMPEIGEMLSIRLNDQSRQISVGTTIAALLTELGLNSAHVAVEVNLELAPRDRTCHASVSRWRPR